MLDFTVTLGTRVESLHVMQIGENIDRAIRRALTKAGAWVERQAKKNLSGPSHTRFPGNGNPYPGVLTGRLRASVTSQVGSDGMSVRIGPNTVYAAIQEFGGTAGRGGSAVIPARPYMWPAFEVNHDKIVDTLREEIMRGVA